MTRIVAVLLGGVLYALALPPFDWSLLGWFALVPLLASTREETIGSSFRLGLLGGYATGWSTQWWLADSVRTYFDLAPPLAVGAIAVGHLVVWGIPFAVFAAGSSVLRRRRTPMLAVPLVAATWVATELLRARVIGQPWALLGYTQYSHPAVIQIATLAGVYGVSLQLALSAAAVAEAGWQLRRERALRSAGRMLLWWTIPMAATAAGWLFLRVASVGSAPHQVVVVQSNLSPARHWTREYSEAQLRAHLRLSDSIPGSIHPGLIVWPEYAVSRYPEEDALVAARLIGVTRKHGADLLFGAPRFDARHVYNSVRLLRADRPGWLHYDKQRLVPFAEEPILGSEVTGAGESPEAFRRGAGTGVLRGALTLGVSICHEILHPDLINASVREGAELLVNVANDGLLDPQFQIAPVQHTAMATLRAVETRRFLVRAATMGPSVVIDPLGRVSARLPQGTRGVLTVKVGERRQLTPYARYGDLFAVACTLAGLAALPRVRVPLRRQRSRPVLVAR